MITPDVINAFGMTLGLALISALYYFYCHRKKDVAVSILLYSTFIFSIIFFVSFENNLGLGIGLLGILSLIRLRSALENLVDISFIFYAITIGLLGASIPDFMTLFYAQISLTAITLFFSSNYIFGKSLMSTQIILDEIILENLSRQSELKSFLKKRYGIQPVKVNIKKIDYLKDSIVLDVSYYF